MKIDFEISKSERSTCADCGRKIKKGVPRVKYAFGFVCYKCAGKFLKGNELYFHKREEDWNEYINRYSREIVISELK